MLMCGGWMVFVAVVAVVAAAAAAVVVVVGTVHIYQDEHDHHVHVNIMAYVMLRSAYVTAQCICMQAWHRSQRHALVMPRR